MYCGIVQCGETRLHLQRCCVKSLLFWFFALSYVSYVRYVRPWDGIRGARVQKSSIYVKPELTLSFYCSKHISPIALFFFLAFVFSHLYSHFLQFPTSPLSPFFSPSYGLIATSVQLPQKQISKSSLNAPALCTMTFSKPVTRSTPFAEREV
jgi:hypothetical protein